MTKAKTIQIVDLFCGAGGESTGILAAAGARGLKVELSAVNQWETAIETHSANHPAANHYCTGVDCLDPCKVVPGGQVALLWASPECTHHSNARGGRPRSDQSRASAWLVLKWLQELYCERVIIENVREMLSWGPLDKEGKPIEARKGETFRAWIAAIRSLGYQVSHRILNAADFGAATTRERLFIQAVRAPKRICWPSPTHSSETGGLFDLHPWRPARDIIDWSLPGESILARKKPLAEATMRRIEHGIARYWGAAAEPFLVILRGTSTSRSIDLPAPTITAGGGHLGIVEPFVLATGQGGRVRGIDRPLSTVVTKAEHCLIEPLVIQNMHCNRARPVSEPVPTVTTGGNCCLLEPLILHQMSPGRSRPVSEPVPTVTTTGAHALILPYYGGTEGGASIEAPMPTVTCKDKFALVEGVPCQLDIRFRMFQPRELASAQSFPTDYQFSGNKGEQVRQIGNAVPPALAEALAGAGFDGARAGR